MAEPIHPAAIPHLPIFITEPGQSDVLLLVMGIFVLISVIGLGIVYLRLHALPEQLAHRGQKLQFQIVAVLGLLALFTHNHAFWIAGLLLALVPLPDFGTPLASMARSLQRIAHHRGHPAPAAPPVREAPPPAIDQPASDQPSEQPGA